MQPRSVIVAVVVLLGLVGGLAYVALGTTTFSRGRQPTAEESRALLLAAHEAAAAQDWDRLCGAGIAASEGLCRQYVEDGIAPLASPPDAQRPPVIVCQREAPASSSSPRGFALRVEGIDGEGQHYESDVLIIATAAGARMQMPVFWDGVRIAATSESDTHWDPCLGDRVTQPAG
ncbi:hypothetical protein [Ruania rhizosphaerae]|uniref:hypothetical protein n=1 Tax=Ruania rhizosphaerae TaxID=1840413 RepID=UPI00135846A7|nr:hypothetical protein [Ruania rhizosphaerae]